MTRYVVSLTMSAVTMHRASSLASRAKARASTRFVKWSRCFLRSGVIGKACPSIRDGTFSIAPSLTWRAQWRNVRRQRRRRQRLQRRRSALRSGSRRETFSTHVTESATSTRTTQIERDVVGFTVTTEGVGETTKSLRRPRSFWGPLSMGVTCNGPAGNGPRAGD
jgi:hypothetical protein